MEGPQVAYFAIIAYSQQKIIVLVSLATRLFHIVVNAIYIMVLLNVIFAFLTSLFHNMELLASHALTLFRVAKHA